MEINYLNPGGVYEFNELFEVTKTRGVAPWLGHFYGPRNVNFDAQVGCLG